MLIKGKMVLLRAIELEDAEILRGMINDSSMEKMMWGHSFPVSKYQQNEWIHNLSNDQSAFRAMIEVDGKTIGTIILSNIDMKNGNAEVHIKLAKKGERGKGYGSDAVLALLEYAFNELRLHCVYCRIKADNEISKKMVEKCGFIKEGCLRSRVFKNGVYADFFEYSILQSEFNNR